MNFIPIFANNKLKTMKLRISSCLMTMLLLWAVQAKADNIERRFAVFNASDGLSDNSAQSIVCTKTGRMVITTIGHVNFYDGKGFSSVEPSQETAYELPRYTGHYHPYFDKYHHLWLKNKRSVTCVNLTVEAFIANIDSVFAELGAKAHVDDMFADQDGQVWMLCGNKIFGSEVKKDFPVEKGKNLQDLIVYDAKQLLLFYDDGEVVSFDLATQKLLYRQKAYDEATVKKYYRTSLARLHDNTVLQIRDGEKEGILLQFDVKKRQWTTLMTLPYKFNNLVVHHDVVYLASEYGYWTYNLRTRETMHAEELTMENGKKLLTDINTIEFDRQGGMWLGTEKRGLLYAKPFPPPFRTYEWTDPQAIKYYNMLETQPAPVTEFKGESVNCVFTDSRHWTWVGTRSGLRLYKSQAANPIVFTRREGLFNNVIHSIAEDLDGNIWVSTSYGISYIPVFRAQVGTVTSYNQIDNIPNETFSNGRAMRLKDGTIVMQSLDHVVAFNPAMFHHDTFRDFKFYPKLVGLMVNGTMVQAGSMLDGKLILDRAITRVREINVNYNHNTLSFVFSGLNFFRPIQTYYRYRVPELNPEWRVVSFFNSGGLVDSRGMFHLPLTGLKPGEYHIEVQASMYPDVWIQEPFTWLLYVNEPWWRTQGVYISLGLIVLILLALNLLFYSRNVRMKMRRTVGEQEVVRQLRNMISRYDSLGKDSFSAQMRQQESPGQKGSVEAFCQLVTKVAPRIREHRETPSLSELTQIADTDMLQFINLVSQHVSTNSYELALRLHLQKACELLRGSKLPIEQIAEDCGFATPNFFVASFYGVYKQTPLEYRSAKP